MSGMAAARLGDPIGHVSIWARLARSALRVGAMLVEALLVAAVVTAGAALIGVTAGCGTFLVAGLIFAFAASASGYNDAKEKMIQKVDVGSPDITGALGQPGSPDVKINKKSAMRAIIDAAVCSKHSDNPPHIAEGSDSVFIDTYPAARKDDKLECSAKIAEGSPNVFFGGNKTQYLDIADDKEWWETGIEIVAGLLMMKGGFLGRFGCLVGGMAIGMAVDAAGKAFRSWIGHPVNPVTGGKILDGSDDTDFVLPGPLPIEWKRFYSSHDARSDLPLGRGWGLPYTVELHVVRTPGQTEALIYVDHQGRKIDLPMIEPGHALFNTAEAFIIGRTRGGYFEVTTLDQLHRQFDAVPEGPGIHVLKLQRIADRNGNWLRFRYDDAGKLVVIGDSIGRILRLRYEDGTTVSAIDLERAAPDEQPGRLVSYRYNQGQLTEVIDRLGVVTRRFAYDDGLMVEHAYPGGLSCHYAWEAHGTGLDGDRRVIRHWTNDGDAWDISYTAAANGGTTVAVDQLGRRDSWTWDGRYNLTGYTNPLGHKWVLEWNENRDLLGIALPDGGRWSYAYNDNGLLVTETDPLGRTTGTSWDDRWHEPRKIVTPDDATWRYEYDDKGNLTLETAPDGSQTITAFDNRGLPIQITDARNGIKRLTWTPRAQLETYTDCSGKATRYEYDPYGNPARITDALGQETRLQHDALGRLITATSPDGANHTWQYDRAGRLIGETDPLARQTHYTLDTRGRLTRRIDPAGRQIALAYDTAQRLAHLIPENGQPYDFTYDAADRLIEEKRPDGTRLGYEYDAASQLVAITHHPGVGDDILTEIDAATTGQPAPAIAVASGPRRTALIRDAAGQLVEKRCGTQVSRYRYDAAGRLIEAKRVELPASDAQGAVPSRLTFSNAPLEPQPVHSVRFAYDQLGRLVSETSTDHVRGESHTLRHDHDVLGNRVRTDLPDLPGRAARSLHYLHYGSGHLHQVRLGLGQTEDGTPAAWQIVADFERDDLHREILRTQGKLSTRQFLDPLGRRLGAWTRPGAGLGMLSDDTTGFNNAQAQGASLLEGITKAYRYDPTGELRESRHAFKGSTRFDYDPTGRIQTVARQNRAGQSQDEHFAYDPSGNLLDAQTPAGRGYVRDNRIRVFEDKRFAYDGLGRLIEKRSGKHMRQTFLWDDEDRLVEVTTLRQSGTLDETRQSVRFEYDAIGRRILKEDAFGATRFIWEGMRLIEERRGAHATAYLYEPGGYVPLARVDTGAVPGEAAGDEASPSTAQAEVLYFHTDPSGMPEELSDSRGHIRWRAAYKTWGNTLKETWEAVGLDGRPAEVQRSEVRPANEALPIEQNLRFQGQYLDRDTGLHYNTFRYYDPDIGRFISPDPIGLRGSVNLYSYAPNPISWIDPRGWFGEKPPNSPDLSKWIAKGGSVHVERATGTWVYSDSQGRSVRYPNGHPDFSPHAVQTVSVGDLKGNHGKNPGGDFGKADAAAIAQGGQAADYKNNTWHHHEDMTTMQEVPKDIHGSFTHQGGVSRLKALIRC